MYGLNFYELDVMLHSKQEIYRENTILIQKYFHFIVTSMYGKMSTAGWLGGCRMAGLSVNYGNSFTHATSLPEFYISSSVDCSAIN